MVRVLAAQVVDVQGDQGVVHKSLEEFAHQIDVEAPDRRAGEIDAEHEARTPGKVNDDARQRLVERHVGVAVASQPFLVAERRGQRLPQRNTDVFDGVMRVDVQVALGLDLEVELPVTRHLLEHVIEEGNAACETALAAAVEIETDAHLGFEGVSADIGLPHVNPVMDESCSDPRRAGRFCPATPAAAHDTILTLPCIPCREPHMSQYWSALVHTLTPYVPGEQPKLPDLVKLNTNENPYPPSPRALAAMQAELGADAARLRLYPDPNGDLLKHAVAEHFAEHGIEPAQVFVGNGSDEVLAHAFLALLKHAKPLLLPDISYSFYPVYCGLYGIAHTPVPLDDEFAIRVDDYLARAGDCGGVIVANPNAPTGRPLPLNEIDRLCAGLHHAVVVIDEAYIDFGGETAAALIARHPNLLVVRTLSKSHALAGLRVGYALGQAPLIEALERVKNSFNSYPLDRLALVGAAAALADREWLETTRHAVMNSRAQLVADLESLGFAVLPSAANFIFARHPGHDAAQLAARLRERNIIVRHFRQPRIDQHLRISIGTDAECHALVNALRAILA